MTFVYYEVYSNSPYLDERHNIQYNSEFINRYSVIEKARRALRRWADIKGIYYEDKHYTTGLSENDAVVEGVGVFFDSNDCPVKFENKWDYGTFACIVKKELVLDEE